MDLALDLTVTCLEIKAIHREKKTLIVNYLKIRFVLFPSDERMKEKKYGNKEHVLAGVLEHTDCDFLQVTEAGYCKE